MNGRKTVTNRFRVLNKKYERWVNEDNGSQSVLQSILESFRAAH